MELAEILFFLHVGFAGTGALLITLGISVALWMRRKRWWLTLHRTGGVLGSMAIFLGCGMAASMVSVSSGEHFRHAHTWAGGITALGTIAVTILGYLQFQVRKRLDIRDMHRWSGRVTFVLALASVFSGLRVIGIL